MTDVELTPSQYEGLKELLGTDRNVFLTGGPGTGKSFLIKEFLKRKVGKISVVASTGAAALLVGGRTFHSFFGLGIMQGGEKLVIEKALKNSRLKKRLQEATEIIVDEVSMLSQEAFDCAEKVVKALRRSQEPWGGIRLIVVGDFAQLPPIGKGFQRQWCFLGKAWRDADFKKIVLEEVKRTEDSEFLNILEQIRWGEKSEKVEEFLNKRVVEETDVDDDVPHLFPRRAQTEAFNKRKLDQIPKKARLYETEYGGKKKFKEQLMRDAPIPLVLELKESAIVMFRVNDPKQRFVNGTVGRIIEMRDESLLVKVRHKEIEVDPFTFSLLDDEGEEIAYAINFPLHLAYASTIHKIQGATLDRVHISLKGLWEPGQAYVALSRARSGKAVTLRDWGQESIKADPVVQAFYNGEDVMMDEEEVCLDEREFF